MSVIRDALRRANDTDRSAGHGARDGDAPVSREATVLASALQVVREPLAPVPREGTPNASPGRWPRSPTAPRSNGPAIRTADAAAARPYDTSGSPSRRARWFLAALAASVILAVSPSAMQSAARRDDLPPVGHPVPNEAADTPVHQASTAYAGQPAQYPAPAHTRVGHTAAARTAAAPTPAAHTAAGHTAVAHTAAAHEVAARTSPAHTAAADAFTLTGILIGGSDAIAVINDTTVRTGDRVDNATVKRIHANGVTLLVDDRLVSLPLRR